LADSAKEKREAAKKREHIDSDALIQAGKWLTTKVGLCAIVLDFILAGLDRTKQLSVVRSTTISQMNVSIRHMHHLLTKRGLSKDTFYYTCSMMM
jgi:hypothetical protein